jgi:hypothetical protein
VTLLGGFALASGCVAGNDAVPGSFVGFREGGLPPLNVVRFDSGVEDAANAGDGGGIDGHCGTADYCGPMGGIPDDPRACSDYDGGVTSGSPKVDAGVAASDAAAADATASRDAGTDVVDGGKDAALRSADDLDASSSSKGRGLPVPAPLPPLPDAAPRLACQVVSDNSGGPVRRCLPSGLGGMKSPCNSVSDCAPGFGCVGSNGTGQCFRYCCRTTADCGDGNFCAERPLLDGDSDKNKKPLFVPVCAPGEDCALLEPFPCMGDGCSCDDPATTACAVVRTDGTRGCVVPGTGRVNDACPCAAGYYCSLATSSCVKICKTDGIDERCAPGKCQAAAGFPAGFGLCVGYVPAVQ